MKKVDVIVSGGGLVGLTAALYLSSLGRRVMLVEDRRPITSKGALGFYLRTVLLSPSSIDFIAKVASIDSVRNQVVSGIKVWESEGTGSIHFRADELGKAMIGSIFEMTTLVDFLWHQLSCVEIECPARVGSVELGDKAVVAKLTNGVIVTGDLLMIAEGTGSATRQMLAVNQRTYESNEKAIVSVARMESAHGELAYQRFGEGPLALLPLPSPHYVSVIWSAPKHVVQGRSAPSIIGLLKREIEAVLGEVSEIDEVSQFGIRQSLVDDFNPFQRVLIVGDSARNLHPMAGQGVNLGVEDLFGISKVAQRQVPDMGSPKLWRRYAARRKVRSLGMISIMQFFQSTYKWTDPYARWLRNVGVRKLDRSPRLKRQLMREAMGIGPISEMY